MLGTTILANPHMSRGIEFTYSFRHKTMPSPVLYCIKTKQPTRLKRSLFIKHKPWEWSTDQSHNDLSKSEDLLVGAQSPPCCSSCHLVRNGHRFSHLLITTWRIIPVSKWLVIPIYKPFSPFGRGITLFSGLTDHGC